MVSEGNQNGRTRGNARQVILAISALGDFLLRLSLVPVAWEEPESGGGGGDRN